MTSRLHSICAFNINVLRPYHSVMVTAQGLIKKTAVKEFVSIMKNGKKAFPLRRGDRLKHVGMVREGDGVLIGAEDGNVIHFASSTIRSSSRTAGGVKAMKFRAPPSSSKAGKEAEEGEEEEEEEGAEGSADDDVDDTGEALPAKVAGMAVVPAAVVESLGLAVTSKKSGDAADAANAVDGDSDATGVATGPLMLVLSSSGRGKRMPLALFNQQGRGGSGKIAIGLKPPDRLAALCLINSVGGDGGGGGGGGDGDGVGESGGGGGAEGASSATSDAHENVIIGSQLGVMNRIDVNTISVQGRTARGVTVMKLKEGDVIRDLTLIPADASALLRVDDE